eukprot:TRINITY_DN3285_c6_g1_i1.p3 TRINITY_DN3285_c6_g1~~TRINITY_DN3285_c6_g1_i1.p3  ORF type:complete len:175 (+),score=60.93 TRINITY_DN3285_c6_g1_i1:66-527(+)
MARCGGCSEHTRQPSMLLVSVGILLVLVSVVLAAAAVDLHEGCTERKHRTEGHHLQNCQDEKPEIDTALRDGLTAGAVAGGVLAVCSFALSCVSVGSLWRALRRRRAGPDVIPGADPDLLPAGISAAEAARILHEQHVEELEALVWEEEQEQG